MRRYWLKALGSAANPIADDWTTAANGILTRHATFARKPDVRAGDSVIYYAAGSKLIFAEGDVTSHPYENGNDSPAWPWRVDVELEVAKRFVHDGARLELLNVPTSRNAVGLRIKRRSHVQLSEEEFEAGVRALRDDGHERAVPRDLSRVSPLVD